MIKSSELVRHHFTNGGRGEAEKLGSPPPTLGLGELFRFADGLDYFLMTIEISCWMWTGKRQSTKMRIKYLEATFNQDIGGLDINWSSVRNVMDMNAGYGGFATVLMNLPLWVMNVVPIHETDTLPVIFDRGLIGVYHDWCESLNTYPRTYNLMHSNFLFINLTQRCDMIDVAVDMDRVLRPGGYLLVQESMEIINKLASILKSLHWSVNVHQE